MIMICNNKAYLSAYIVQTYVTQNSTPYLYHINLSGKYLLTAVLSIKLNEIALRSSM